MKKYLLLSLFSLILFARCGSDSGGDSLSPVSPVVKKQVLLKIDTILYDKDDGLSDTLSAEGYARISVNSGSGAKYYDISALSEGIKVPEDTTITIKVEHESKNIKYKI